MAVEIEANLRIPTLTIRAPGEPDQRIDNSGVRFLKRMTVPAVPKAGDSLQVSVQGVEPFDCSVTRADWHEGKMLFVVACAYGRRSITPAEYQALIADPAWVSTPLL